MAPTTTVEKELIGIAQAIRDYQKARELSDTQLLKKFAGLGSTKTYTRILAGDVADLDTERWLLEYRQVQTLIDALAGDSEEEPLYDDLTSCGRLRVAVVDAMRERGNARLVIVQGPSGSGKTWSARALAERFGSKVVLTEADETWKDSIQNMLGGLLRGLGVREPPLSAADRLGKLFETLASKELTIVIDEAHHLGPRTLNLVKTIINQSGVVVVLCAMDTLFRRLEMQAYEEARQLTQNRLCERVRLGEIDSHDVEKFLGRRLKWANGDLRRAVETTKSAAKDRGHFAFIKAAVRRARRDHGEEPLTIEQWSEAIAKTVKSR